MNYIKHLTGFFNHIAVENSLNPTHISLYITIFQCWNVNRFKNPITINRDEMMRGSKIASTATYHKCIKDLQRLGYLKYNPSFNSHQGTSITLNNFSGGINPKDIEKEPTSSKIEQANKLTLPKIEPSNELAISKNEQVSEQVDEQPYIYNNKTNTNKINKSNITNFYIEPEFEIFNNDLLFENQEKEKSSAKKEQGKTISLSPNEIPSLELTKEFFNFQEYSEFEAERFFNYYSSNGWLIGGKTKMIDWKASARNWMLNTSKFTINTPSINLHKDQPQAHNLHTIIDKNYAEPL